MATFVFTTNYEKKNDSLFHITAVPVICVGLVPTISNAAPLLFFSLKKNNNNIQVNQIRLLGLIPVPSYFGENT